MSPNKTMTEDQLATALEALEAIADADCTGPYKDLVCYAVGIPRRLWCPKCIAEKAVTAIQNMKEEEA